MYNFLMYYSENQSWYNVQCIQEIKDKLLSYEIVEIHQLLRRKRFGIFTRSMSHTEISRLLRTDPAFANKYIVGAFISIVGRFFALQLDAFSPKQGPQTKDIIYLIPGIRNSQESTAFQLRTERHSLFALLKQTRVIPPLSKSIVSIFGKN